jgi:hypothetical protein
MSAQVQSAQCAFPRMLPQASSVAVEPFHGRQGPELWPNPDRFGWSSTLFSEVRTPDTRTSSFRLTFFFSQTQIPTTAAMQDAGSFAIHHTPAMPLPTSSLCNSTIYGAPSQPSNRPARSKVMPSHRYNPYARSGLYTTPQFQPTDADVAAWAQTGQFQSTGSLLDLPGELYNPAPALHDDFTRWPFVGIDSSHDTTHALGLSGSQGVPVAGPSNAPAPSPIGLGPPGNIFGWPPPGGTLGVDLSLGNLVLSNNFPSSAAVPFLAGVTPDLATLARQPTAWDSPVHHPSLSPTSSDATFTSFSGRSSGTDTETIPTNQRSASLTSAHLEHLKRNLLRSQKRHAPKHHGTIVAIAQARNHPDPGAVVTYVDAASQRPHKYKPRKGTQDARILCPSCPDSLADVGGVERHIMLKAAQGCESHQVFMKSSERLLVWRSRKDRNFRLVCEWCGNLICRDDVAARHYVTCKKRPKVEEGSGKAQDS